jgi:hypothetical protein
MFTESSACCTEQRLFLALFTGDWCADTHSAFLSTGQVRQRCPEPGDPEEQGCREVAHRADSIEGAVIWAHAFLNARVVVDDEKR